MKKILILVLLLALTSSITASDSLFKTFQLSYVAGNYLDWGLTRYSLSIGFTEVGPIARLYMEEPALSFAIYTGVNILTYKLTSILYKQNKTLGWITIIALNCVKAFVLYHNMREIGWLR